jgi:hypothetical protein
MRETNQMDVFQQPLENKKAEPPEEPSFGSSAIPLLAGPAAFRPLLTKGLALSSKLLLKIHLSKNAAFVK